MGTDPRGHFPQSFKATAGGVFLHPLQFCDFLGTSETLGCDETGAAGGEGAAEGIKIH